MLMMMMRKVTLLVLLVVVFGLLVNGKASANLLASGSFELGAIGVVPDGSFEAVGHAPWLPSNAISGWTVTSGNVDWVHTDFFQASDGDYNIDLSGVIIAGELQSDEFATVIGLEYSLTFDMAGNPQGSPTVKSLFVDVGDASNVAFFFDTTGITEQNLGWIEMSLNFMATSSTSRVTFRSGVSSGYGPLLDNVAVVPERNTALLLGFGLVGLGIKTRRRRAVLH